MTLLAFAVLLIHMYVHGKMRVGEMLSNIIFMVYLTFFLQMKSMNM